MLSIEEYIARRKKEDKLFEFDFEQRNENMRLCVNYVFEYFNNYLAENPGNEKMALHDEKLEKYRRQLKDYEKDTQDWLVQLFDQYGHQLNKSIHNFLRQVEFFWLYDSDSDFRSLSYECYNYLIVKHPFVKDHTEMIFKFIKEFHKIEGRKEWGKGVPFISAEINEWIENVWLKHGVNLFTYSFDWIDRFERNRSLWPIGHKKKDPRDPKGYEYDYTQKTNLFGVNDLYRRIPKKAFIRGKKQELEVLFMYHWLHDMSGNLDYWDNYLAKVYSPELSN